jgi:hypothetical protein
MRTYLALGSLSLFLTGAAAHKPPSIEGSYRLVARELPDGTKLVPPDIAGMITYTAKYRNLNVYWKGADGKSGSASGISTYRLSGKDYQETNVYSASNDESSGKGVTYDLSSTSGMSPVSQDGGRIEMKLPLHDEPKLTFDGDKMTARKEGQFVDHWVKIQ